MELYIIDPAGGRWQLPALRSWDISHGYCEPCDCFSVETDYAPDMLETLRRAAEAEGIYEGSTVFRGRVDGFRVRCSGTGLSMNIWGRSMQALMLDNEAESADYMSPDLNFILERHVKALGITNVDAAGAAGQTLTYSVGNGWSHWKAFSSFAEFCCGLRPRFAPDGTLVVDGERPGRLLALGTGAAAEMEYCEDRSGVISAATVKRRYTAQSARLENPEFIALGGALRAHYPHAQVRRL